jgi:regulator of replication initiation timing
MMGVNKMSDDLRAHIEVLKSQGLSLRAERDKLRTENERLRAILVRARSHVWSMAEAEHMMDGRRVRPSDKLLHEINAALKSTWRNP